jgi:uncharacterized protein YbaA (DUF1428 family)
MANFVEEVKAHAAANYTEDGWDFVVECWADDEIEIATADATTAEEAIAIMAEEVGVLDEHRAEIQSTIW